MQRQESYSNVLVLPLTSALARRSSSHTSAWPQLAAQCSGVHPLMEHDVSRTSMGVYVCRSGVDADGPPVSLVDAACVGYQMVQHGSDVAACNYVKNVFAFNAGGGGSLQTSKM